MLRRVPVVHERLVNSNVSVTVRLTHRHAVVLGALLHPRMRCDAAVSTSQLASFYLRLICRHYRVAKCPHSIVFAHTHTQTHSNRETFTLIE